MTLKVINMLAYQIKSFSEVNFFNKALKSILRAFICFLVLSLIELS